MAIELSIRKKLSEFELDVQCNHVNGYMGILGASGAGKSMLLKCIAGIEKPDSGRIVLNGRILFDSDKKINLSPQKRKIGYLFQNYALFPTMTLEQNIGIALNRHQRKTGIVKEMIEKLYLCGLEKKLPYQLSGGEQQRAALGRLLVCEPDMILLDEPFSAIDSFLKDILQQQLMDYLHAYKGDVIILSHSRDEIFKFSDELIIMKQGTTQLMGNTKEIFKNPVLKEAAILTGCKNISSIRKVSEFEVFLEEWSVTLKTAVSVSDEIRFIGIRAHHFKQVETPGDNRIWVEQVGMMEAPFEIQYKLRSLKALADTAIWWKVSKNNDCNDTLKEPIHYLYIAPEDLLLLQ